MSLQSAGDAEKRDIVERNASLVHGAKVIVSGAARAKEKMLMEVQPSMAP